MCGLFYLNLCMAFDIDFAKEGEIKLHIKKFLLYPIFWNDNSKHIGFALNWKKIKFTKANAIRIPNTMGIYCFVVKPKVPNFFDMSYLFYIGQTQRTLSIRYKEYLNDQEGKGKPRTKVFKMLKQYNNDLYFYYSSIGVAARVDEAEDKLINIFMPHINTKISEAKISPELKYLYE